MNEVIVHKGRYNRIIVNLGISAVGSTFVSEIRTNPTVESILIAAWTIGFLTDGTDGKLVLTLDDTVRNITASKGFMDLKRVVFGVPIPVFDQPLEVLIRGTVSA